MGIVSQDTLLMDVNPAIYMNLGCGSLLIEHGRRRRKDFRTTLRVKGPNQVLETPINQPRLLVNIQTSLFSLSRAIGIRPIRWSGAGHTGRQRVVG